MKIAIMILFGIAVLVMPFSSFAGNCGDVDNSGTINILDVTYLINYLYKSGPDPDCGTSYPGICGDVDNSGTINILDVTYLINYLYKGGPEPSCGLHFQSINLTSGTPGTIITIYGVEYPEPIEDLMVIFDTITFSAYSRTDSNITIACPALAAGSYQISMDHPFAAPLIVADFEVLEPLPTGLPPGEVATELVTSISTINTSVISCAQALETSGLITAGAIDSLQVTVSRLDSILADAINMINDLPDSEKVILDQIMDAAGLADLFGASGPLQNVPLDTVDLRNFIYNRADYAAFNGLILADNVSFGLSVIKPALLVVNIASALSTLGLSAPANVTLAIISFEITALDNLIDGFIPTELYNVDLVVNPENEGNLVVGQPAPIEYWGYFETQSGPITATLDIFIRGAFAFLPADAVDDLIADMVTSIGIGALEDILENQQVLTLSEPVPIDISYYQLSGQEVVGYAGLALSGILPGIQLVNTLSYLGYTFPMLAITPLNINSSLVELSADLLTITGLQQGVVEPNQIDMRGWVINGICEGDNSWWWSWVCLGIELPEMLESSAFTKPQIVIQSCDCPPTVTDIDGNVYQTVLIGNQCWMMENLKVTHYRNGEPIPKVMNKIKGFHLSTGAYCDYNNDESISAVYGRLYNWFAIGDNRGLAPDGWHIPSDYEWKQLEMHLGMSQAAADAIEWRGTDEGGKLKETGTSHWNSPNAGATNESGFTALPGGFSDLNGFYDLMGFLGYFWSSSESNTDSSWKRCLACSGSQVYRYHHAKQHGCSIRCIKD